MKYTTCLSLFSLLSLTTSLAIPVYAQGKSSTNGHSLLGSSFTKKLKSIGIKIALPKYVPQGFWIAAVRTDPCRRGDTVNANGVCRFGPDYTVIYRNPQNHCFAVDATGGGLGGPSSRYTRAVRSKIFDKVDVMIGTGNDRPITDEIADTPQVLRSDYAGKSPFYSVRTIDSKAANRINAAIICSDTAHMTPNEFIKIVKSLDWLPQSTSSVSSAPSQEEVEETAQRQFENTKNTDKPLNADAETLYQTFEEISQSKCYTRSITEQNIKYSICNTLAGAASGRPGSTNLFSASKTPANIEVGEAGFGYWYYPSRRVAAIEIFHDNQLFMFDRSGKLQAELIRDQSRSIRTTFTKAERDRLEKLAREGSKEILSKFK